MYLLLQEKKADISRIDYLGKNEKRYSLRRDRRIKATHPLGITLSVDPRRQIPLYLQMDKILLHTNTKNGPSVC